MVPIVQMTYPLLPRTLLQAGMQGWGPLPYRFEDQVQNGNSFARRTAFVNLTNRSRYFGYDLYTIVGVERDRRQFDVEFQRYKNFDTWRFIVRSLVGFTEYGSLL